ncbi:MAG: hypothetical protein AB1898_09500 [Acidobacteriota bacterium]
MSEDLELDFVGNLQQVIVGYSEYFQNWSVRWECLVGIRGGLLAIVDGADDNVEAALENFNRYHELIQRSPRREPWMLEKLIDHAIQATRHMAMIVVDPTVNRLKRESDGDLTDDCVEALDKTLQQWIERVNLLRRLIADPEKLPRTNQRFENDVDSIAIEINPIQWKGSDTDLIDLFATLRDKHYLDHSSDYQLTRQLVKHFIGKGGKRLNAANLLKLLQQRKDAHKTPFDCIPENSRA